MIDKVELNDIIHQIDYSRTIDAHDRVSVIDNLDKWCLRKDNRLEKLMSLCRTALYKNERQAWDKVFEYMYNEYKKDKIKSKIRNKN